MAKGTNKAAELQQALGKQDHEAVNWSSLRQLHDGEAGSIEETDAGKAPVGGDGSDGGDAPAAAKRGARKRGARAK
jgi:hypothetical protein